MDLASNPVAWVYFRHACSSPVPIFSLATARRLARLDPACIRWAPALRASETHNLVIDRILAGSADQ